MSVKQAFTLEQASRLGRVSARQASYWARERILVPSILYDRTRRPNRYLYSFTDVVGLRTLGLMRNEYGLSLQSLRRAATALHDHSDRPWSELRFWIRGKDLFFQDPSTHDLVSAMDGSQTTLSIEIEPIAASVKAEAETLWIRKPEDIGQIERRRNVLHNQPVIKGTRVPVSSIINLANDGMDIDDIVRAYPSLTPDDVRGVLHSA